MPLGYTIDEVISAGLQDMLVARLNTVVEEDNAVYDDAYPMPLFEDGRIIDYYLPLEDLMSKVKAMPAVSYFMVNSTSDIRTSRLLELHAHRFLCGVFTSGQNGSTLVKRYKASFVRTIEENFDEIAPCIKRARISSARYYVPARFNATDYWMVELILEVHSEVRK